MDQVTQTDLADVLARAAMLAATVLPDPATPPQAYRVYEAALRPLAFLHTVVEGALLCQATVPHEAVWAVLAAVASAAQSGVLTAPQLVSMLMISAELMASGAALQLVGCLERAVRVAHASAAAAEGNPVPSHPAPSALTAPLLPAMIKWRPVQQPVGCGHTDKQLPAADAAAVAEAAVHLMTRFSSASQQLLECRKLLEGLRALGAGTVLAEALCVQQAKLLSDGRHAFDLTFLLPQHVPADAPLARPFIVERQGELTGMCFHNKRLIVLRGGVSGLFGWADAASMQGGVHNMKVCLSDVLLCLAGDSRAGDGRYKSGVRRSSGGEDLLASLTPSADGQPWVQITVEAGFNEVCLVLLVWSVAFEMWIAKPVADLSYIDVTQHLLLRLRGDPTRSPTHLFEPLA